jgi:propanol-preferring alcohol dehydrogenase
LKALKLSEPLGTLALVDADIPSPAAGEVLIRVQASGLCYTDVHICDDDWSIVNAMVKRDLTLGHEAVGIVTALGEGVTGIAVGQRVTAWFLRSACGSCKPCRRGEENLCLTPTLIGLSHDGSHAEYVTALADFVVPVPDEVSSEQAAPLACAGMSVLGALRNADVSVGTTFAVIGVGGQGHLAVQIAKAMGATVVALDIGPDKLALARRLGADRTFDVTDPATMSAAAALGIDVVMVTAPSHDAHRLGLAIVANGGTISLCAVPGGETPISMTLCAFKGLKLVTQAVATRRELTDVLALAAAGKVTCTVETRPLSDAVASVDQLRDGGVVGRVVFVP